MLICQLYKKVDKLSCAAESYAWPPIFHVAFSERLQWLALFCPGRMTKSIRHLICGTQRPPKLLIRLDFTFSRSWLNPRRRKVGLCLHSFPDPMVHAANLIRANTARSCFLASTNITKRGGVQGGTVVKMTMGLTCGRFCRLDAEVSKGRPCEVAPLNIGESTLGGSLTTFLRFPIYNTQKLLIVTKYILSIILWNYSEWLLFDHSHCISGLKWYKEHGFLL